MYKDYYRAYVLLGADVTAAMPFHSLSSHLGHKKSLF